jgi:hypothetical protein
MKNKKQKQNEVYKNVRIVVNEDVKKFFNYCHKNGFIVGRKITEVLGIYAQYLQTAAKPETKTEFIKFLEQKGGENEHLGM